VSLERNPGSPSRKIPNTDITPGRPAPVLPRVRADRTKISQRSAFSRQHAVRRLNYDTADAYERREAWPGFFKTRRDEGGVECVLGLECKCEHSTILQHQRGLMIYFSLSQCLTRGVEDEVGGAAGDECIPMWSCNRFSKA
jgi:hypothetical protein